ncbi:Ionotropic receptor 432 [Blattella germanica]|nr:Ionotropic receptor 432 [Blattella germanica]
MLNQFEIVFQVLMLYSLKTTHSTIQTLSITSTIVEDLSECIVDIAQKYFSKNLSTAVLIPTEVFGTSSNDCMDNSDGNKIVLSLNENIVNSLLLLGDQSKPKHLSYDVKPGSFIIIVSGDIVHALRKLMILLAQTKLPSARLLIASTIVPISVRQQTAIAKLFLGAVWDMLQMCNAIAIIPRKHQSKSVKNNYDGFDIFNWFPGKQSDPCFKNLDKIDLLVSWNLQMKRLENNKHLFPNKQITILPGCHLSALTLKHQLSNILSFEDMSYSLHILESVLKTKIRYIPIGKSEVLSDLKFPVARGVNISTAVEECSLTYPHFTENIKWFVPAGVPIPRWKSLTKIFNPLMWTCVVVAFVLGVVTSWYILKYSHTSQQPVDMVSVIINTLLTYLAVGISDRYKGTVGTSFFVVWLFYCLIINTAYQSALIRFLADPGEYSPIKSVQELYESDLNLITTVKFNHAVQNEIQKLNSFKHCVSHEVCMKLISEARNTAILMIEFVGTSSIRASYSSETKKPGIVPIEENVYKIYSSIEIYTYGCLLYERLEELMHLLFSAGLTAKITRETLRVEKMLYSDLLNEDWTFQLKLSHLQGAFYIYVIGFLVSIIAFFLERFVHN